MGSSQPSGFTVDMTPLQLNRSPNDSTDYHLSPAGPATTARPTLAKPVPDLPAKAIGHRWCTANRLGGVDSSGSGNEYVGVRSDGSDEDYFSAPGELPTPPQQKPEPPSNDDDCSWQVVTRRRSRSKQQPPVPAPAVSGDVRVKRHARAMDASASRLCESSSAGRGGTRQLLQASANQPAPLLAGSLRWRICVDSFARLSKLNWATFNACCIKCHPYLSENITKKDFLRFHHMMAKGPQAIRSADDAVFLVAPFRILLSGYGASSDALLLSLMFERTVPGFLQLIGERFVTGLYGVDRHREKQFTAISELLGQICRKDECWLNALGWQKLSTRYQCDLISSMMFLFKNNNRPDLIRELHQRVSGEWLEASHCDALQSLARDGGSNLKARLRDLKASVQAFFSWLEGQFFIIAAPGERQQLITRLASIVENLIKVMGSLDLRRSKLLFAMWQIVTQGVVRFRKHLSGQLGADRAIVLLSRLLHSVQSFSGLDGLAFELRLVLLGTVLIKCDDLLLKRDCSLFPQAWHQYENMLESLLAKCNQFMASYQTPFAVYNQSVSDQRKEGARLDLLLRESIYHRLLCVSTGATRQRIQENLQVYRNAFTDGWALCPDHHQMGAIELARWCFLAGEHDSAVSTLLGVKFELPKLCWRKADLLARHGEYRAAINELRYMKTLKADLSETDQRRRGDEVDDRIAMTQLQWYEAEGDIGNLISAYRLSVDLLGHCDVRNRRRFEGGLAHIVNAMNYSGLRFQDYAEQTSVLGYLVNNGCGIKSWYHFADLLYIRRKLGLSSTDTTNKVAAEIGGKRILFLGQGKTS